MTNMKHTLMLFCAAFGLAFLSSCNEDDTEPTSEQAVTSAIINPEVGGPNQPNQVFVDLSSKTQTAIDRSSWDLGFSTGSEFRVILNNPTSMLAQAIEKTDLSNVTAEDTVGMGSRMDVDAIFGAVFGAPADWLPQAQTWLDNPNGDLTGTAVSEVSANAEENRVYIINRGKNADGTNRGWMKARFLRSEVGYRVQYAEINAQTFSETAITKNTDYNFNYFSFENGSVQVEPAKSKWDLAFTVFTDLLPVSASAKIPYAIKDYVIQNVQSVEVAQVDAILTAYADFNLGQALDLDFSSQLTSIGTGWRNVAQPNSDLQTGVNAEVFYVVKDAANNYYKLKFTRMLDPITGERGFPQIQYDLLLGQD